LWNAPNLREFNKFDTSIDLLAMTATGMFVFWSLLYGWLARIFDMNAPAIHPLSLVAEVALALCLIIT
jgi:hypothetical protein